MTIVKKVLEGEKFFLLKAEAEADTISHIILILILILIHILILILILIIILAARPFLTCTASPLKVLTNEKRGGLKVVAFDGSPLKGQCHEIFCFRFF